MTRTRFGGTDLMGADFSDGTFNGTGLWLSDLSLSHMRNVDRGNGDHQSDLTQSNLFRVVMQGSDFSDASFSFTLMHAASIIDTSFVDASMGAVDRRLTNRWSARSGDQFNGSQDTGDFSLAWMESSDLRSALLQNAAFDSTNLQYGDLRGTDFANSSFLGTFMSYTQSGAAVFNGSVMDDATLSHSHGGGAQFVGVSCVNCNMGDVTFIDANFSDADLSGANFRHAILKAGSYANTNFTDADLGGVDGLDLADLSGATWSKTLCPDYSNSDSNGGTCIGHLSR